MARLLRDLSAKSKQAWSAFLTADESHCHAMGLRRSLPDDLGPRIAASWAAGLDSAKRISSWLEVKQPSSILDIGCSTGMTALAFAALYPEAKVHGIEPEDVARQVALSMADDLNIGNFRVDQAYGESLPFQDSTFDLIICSTVIEHVQDVEAVIREMARVLAPGGMIYLEAPNYLWPREPHLAIWTVPMLGKRFMRWSAILQGKRAQIAFLEHLQLVTPRRVERALMAHGLEWHNLIGIKARMAVRDVSQIKAYPRLGRLLRLADRAGLLAACVGAMEKTGLYPSLMYKASKKA